MDLAVVIPSRGLVHSRTVAAVLREAPGATVYWAHSRPIPECFNEPIAQAVADGAEWVWIVEEDMHLPVGILAELQSAAVAGHGVVAADYPVRPGVLCTARDARGVVRHSGTGCLLARAATLARYPFRTTHQYLIRGDEWIPQPVPDGDRERVYGMHDVDFGMRLYTDGRPIHVVETQCGQYRIARHATPDANEGGWHDVEVMA